MKVYLLSRSEDYEGQNIQGVYTVFDAAQERADELNNEYEDRFEMRGPYEVIPFEVIE